MGVASEDGEVGNGGVLMAGIFKAYDVRGVYPDELDEDMMRRIGNAYLQFIGGAGKSIVVGRDGRLHSASLKDALVEGLLDGGARVIDIGLCTTPMNYFAIGHLNVDGGLMVTASHNPPQYNGLKVSRAQAFPCSYEGGLCEIEKIVEVGEYVKAAGGQVEREEVLDAYAEHVGKVAGDLSGIRIAVDCGNGIAGPFFQQVFEPTGLTIVGLYMEPDGRFPNHEPNPLKEENLRDVGEAVREHGCDVGLAFDGDGDRCRFVTEEGATVGADITTAFVAMRKLRRHRGAKIVYDVRSSRVVEEEVRKAGGVPVLCRVGHAYMKETMRKEDALFGGELAGHFYFRENFYADSGFLIAATVLRIIKEEEKPFSELLRPLLRYYATGEVNFEVADKDAKIAQIAEHFRKEGADIDFIDGVTVRFDDWWANIRKSNTEPLLRLNLEANSAELRDRMRAEIERLIRS